MYLNRGSCDRWDFKFSPVWGGSGDCVVVLSGFGELRRAKQNGGTVFCPANTRAGDKPKIVEPMSFK